MLRDGAKSRRSRSFVGIAAAAATAVVAIGRSLVGKLRDEIRGARRQITESEYTAGLLRCDQVWSCRKAWPQVCRACGCVAGQADRRPARLRMALLLLAVRVQPVCHQGRRRPLPLKKGYCFFSLVAFDEVRRGVVYTEKDGNNKTTERLGSATGPAVLVPEAKCKPPPS